MGATRSMSSWQWRGGSGSSSVASVMRTSVPQSEHRYWIFDPAHLAGRAAAAGSASRESAACRARRGRRRARRGCPRAAQTIVPNMTRVQTGPASRRVGRNPWARGALRRRCDTQPLDDGGVGHAAALAHRLQAVAAAGALELVEQRGHELGAGAAERVTEGDRAAVDVHLAHVGVVLLLPREHDRARTPR